VDLETGTHTLHEILSQPVCWSECLRAVEENDQLGQVSSKICGAAECLFIGCGSSYYVAQAAAASWTAITGRGARAVPASELLLFPRIVLRDARPCQPVLISRSGHTSEMLRTAEYLELKEDIRTLTITCASHQPLEQVSSATLSLPAAGEESVVMTRSFTSMLLVLQVLAASVANQATIKNALHQLPAAVRQTIDAVHARIRKFAEQSQFADYVFLGQGPYYAVASESMLKVKEMSCSYAQCFHTLEFRHGPKAIVGPKTLITFLLSETGYEAEREVLDEIKSLGGATLVVTNHADNGTRNAADLLVELNLDVPEIAQLAAFVMPAQLLGLFTGLRKGLDPDRPRHLSRAVVLNKKGMPCLS
jgi:glucosamine--fructose-6-phosphate aminotransferase (isomerizing)